MRAGAVYTLAELTRPSWTFGLTDYELAQAALAAFGGKGEEIQYDYRAAGMIQGIFIAATFLLFLKFICLQFDSMSLCHLDVL